MSAAEKHIDEDILKRRYVKASKIILLLALLYFLWVVFIIISVYFLGFGNKWAFFTMDQWILSNIILLVVFIFVELIFILHHSRAKKKRIEIEKPKPMFIKGKRLHLYTIPKDSKGGIFSKTYVKINENNVLNLRFQMILPKDLWGKKE